MNENLKNKASPGCGCGGDAPKTVTDENVTQCCKPAERHKSVDSLKVFAAFPVAPKPGIKKASAVITPSDRIDHIKARVGWNRNSHKVEPGLYAIGSPSKSSPVFVTANYTLSFDALREAIATMDAYILVLDTKGINVWCAAGKGTFGTDELVKRIAEADLKNVVEHRHVILPQLGAVGVAAHLAKKRSGFKVEYGPVRAEDIPEYMKTRKTTPEMRKVRFDLRDRAVLIPVEIVNYFTKVAVISVVLLIVAGLTAMFGFLASAFAGLVMFPLLLPWIPNRNFSVKGYLLGLIATAPFAISAFIGETGWRQWAMPAGYFLLMPPAAAYISLNFTGSTTFTSLSGVKREIERFVPPMAISSGAGAVILAAMFLLKWIS